MYLKVISTASFLKRMIRIRISSYISTARRFRDSALSLRYQNVMFLQSASVWQQAWGHSFFPVERENVLRFKRRDHDSSAIHAEHWDRQLRFRSQQSIS